MRRDNKLNHNTQLEFVFEDEQEERPNRLAVKLLAKRARISEPHARTALLVNGPRHD